MASNPFPPPVGPPWCLDGAMGTALLAAGLPPGAPPERWLVERPEAIAGVHAGHAAAGARLLLTCTFNLAARRLGAEPPAAHEALARSAVALARRGAAAATGGGAGVLVAGALGPLAEARPGGEAPSAAALRRPVAAAALTLAGAGVDLLWLESQYDGREADAALAGALEAGLPVVVTFTLAVRAGRLRAADGGDAEALLLGAARGGAVAVGVNCVAAGDALTSLAAWAAAALPVPLVLKPSPGPPGAVLPPDAFAAALAPALRAAWARLAGAGGCCGAGAGHVEALAALLRDEGPG